MDRTPAQSVCDAIAILTAAGVMDFNGHASLRRSEGSFLINSGASDRAAMTPEQVCRVDGTGSPLDGIRPPNEVALHAAIYAARPDVQAVVHGHPKWSTLFTLTGKTIDVVMPQGCLVADLPVYPDPHSISTTERGAAVAGILGAHRGALLAGHGSVLTGQTLQEAVALAVYTEHNAERAYRARALGSPRCIPAADRDDYRQMLDKPGLYEKCWAFHLSQRRMADVR